MSLLRDGEEFHFWQSQTILAQIISKAPEGFNLANIPEVAQHPLMRLCLSQTIV